MTKKNGKKKAEEVSVPSPGSLKGEAVEQKKEEQVPSNLQNAEITDEAQVQTMPVKSEEKKVEVHFCKDCIGYNKSTEREFHRKVGPRNDKGERTEIIETRAVCVNDKSSSYRHLVMAEYSKRQCPVWEQGVYEKTVEPKKTTEPKKTKKRSKKKDKAKKNNETIEKVEKAFENGAEEVTLDSNGTMKTIPSGPVPRN